MNYEVHPEARAELLASADFYEKRSPGLGIVFLNEIEAAIQRLVENPEQSKFVEQDVRRRLVRRLPYGILYTIEADFILILAVMHCSRQPGYWHQRLIRRNP